MARWRGVEAAIVCAWIALVVGAHMWGRALLSSGQELKLLAPPLFGRVGVRFEPALPAAVIVAAIAVAGLPIVCRRARWRTVLVVVTLVAAAWGVALALNSAPGALTRPLTGRHDYLPFVEAVGSPGRYLAGFTDRIANYPIHVQGHPPGVVLLFHGLGRIGLGSSAVIAAVVIAAGCSASAAALVAAKSMAGETVARGVAPFVALLPSVVWIATSVDALFLGVTAWALALFAVALNRPGRRSDLMAAGGGLLFGAALLLTYGAIPLLAVPLALVLRTRRLRPALVFAAVFLVIVAAPAAGGFSWPEGVLATRAQYLDGVSSTRPYGFFLVANVAAFSLALGPAVLAGLGRLRNVNLWVLVGGALTAVAIADLSGMSKGEVERIWLPFSVWVALGSAGLPLRSTRPWLAAQAGVGLVLAVALRTPW